jgi:hypothetical protein
LDVIISCTEPRFCHWGPSAPKKIDKPGYVRYNTFFHEPKNNKGESNLTLITWFPHRRPLYRWMRLIKIFVLDAGLVILKLTQPLIPAENPNSSKFNGTEGVAIAPLAFLLIFFCETKSETMGVVRHCLYRRRWPSGAHSRATRLVATSLAMPGVLFWRRNLSEGGKYA